MNTNNHELKFEQMKRLSRRMVIIPALALVMAIIVFILEGFPYPGRSSFAHSVLSTQLVPGLFLFNIWYLIVLVLFIVTLIPLIILLVNPGLKKIHPAVRLQVIARFVVYAWIVLFALRIMLSAYDGILWMPEVLIRNIFFGGLLVAAYSYFKKKYAEKPETMFP